MYVYYVLDPCNCTLYTHNICTYFPDDEVGFLEYLRSHPNRFRPSDIIERNQWLRYINGEEAIDAKGTKKKDHCRLTYYNDNGVLKTKGGDKEVVCDTEVAVYIQRCHEKISHAGIQATFKEVQSRYYGIVRKEVQRLLSHCRICHKTAASRARGPLESIVQ